jgi:hypothetical protein
MNIIISTGVTFFIDKWYQLKELLSKGYLFDNLISIAIEQLTFN